MTSSKYLIYGLVDPVSGHIRYVGKSTSGMKRPAEHATTAKAGEKRHVYNWIRQLQSQGLNYRVVVIQELPENDGELLALAEKSWIACYKDLGYKLTNLTDGGDGTTGYRHTPEWKAKASAARKGKKIGPPSPEARLNRSAARTGKKRGSPSPEVRAKLSAANVAYWAAKRSSGEN